MKNIKDYKNIKKLLIKKYGAPKEEGKYWSDDLYKDDKSDYGFAVSVGDLAYAARWQTEKTGIVTTLDGGNYEIDHIIVYSGKIEAAKEAEKSKEENTLDNL